MKQIDETRVTFPGPCDLRSESEGSVGGKAAGQAGFSLIEVMIAMLVVMIAVLGVFATLTYAIQYNSGNKYRSQALAILQQEAELIRSAKYTAAGAPDPILLGGVKPGRLVTHPNGATFFVEVTVDNDPDTPGVQGETHVCTTPQGSAIPCAIKEIEILVSANKGNPGWQFSVPVRLVTRRVRGN